MGEFKNGIFQGSGLLYNTAKKNWACGLFESGNLVDLYQYNNEGGDKKYDKILESLHVKKNNWIDFEIKIPEIQQFDILLEKVLTDAPSGLIKSLDERKQDVLRRIQENFLN